MVDRIKGGKQDENIMTASDITDLTNRHREAFAAYLKDSNESNAKNLFLVEVEIVRKAPFSESAKIIKNNPGTLLVLAWEAGIEFEGL